MPLPLEKNEKKVKDVLCPALLRPPGSPAPSSGALSTGQTWSCWSGAGGGHKNDPRAGTPLLGGKAGRAGAWRRKGSGETLGQLPGPGGAARELERGFLGEHGVTGQGIMVLNSKRGDSDWI